MYLLIMLHCLWFPEMFRGDEDGDEDDANMSDISFEYTDDFYVFGKSCGYDENVDVSFMSCDYIMM